MQHVTLLLVVVVVLAGPAAACRYWCKIDSTKTYECCDDVRTEAALDTTEASGSTQNGESTAVTSSATTIGCVYYCVYDKNVYCCADNSQPIPADHTPHGGRCPEENEQVCKNSGIFLHTKKAKEGKTIGSRMLAEGVPKQLPTCASDGYCAADQKCCATHCARKHVCMKSLKMEGDDEDKE